MALSLVTTIASSDSNSFVTSDYCDTYWAGHYSTIKATQWAALTSSQKIAALIHACRVLNAFRFTEPSHIRYSPDVAYDRRTATVIELVDRTRPTKYYYDQALQFPRSIDVDSTSGALFIPEPVMLAQCEQAVYLLTFDESTLAAKIQGIETDSFSAGGVSMRQQFSGNGSALAPMAYEYIREFLLKTSTKLRRA